MCMTLRDNQAYKTHKKVKSEKPPEKKNLYGLLNFCYSTYLAFTTLLPLVPNQNPSAEREIIDDAKPSRSILYFIS